MGIEINNQQGKPLNESYLTTKAETILNYLKMGDWELSILLTDDNFITELNKKYFNRQGPTNVISFPQTEKQDHIIGELVLGDVVISIDAAEREAFLTEQPLELYLLELLVHGILHLIGFDHEAGGVQEEEMEKKREEIFLFLEKQEAR